MEAKETESIEGDLYHQAIAKLPAIAHNVLKMSQFDTV